MSWRGTSYRDRRRGRRSSPIVLLGTESCFVPLPHGSPSPMEYAPSPPRTPEIIAPEHRPPGGVPRRPPRSVGIDPPLPQVLFQLSPRRRAQAAREAERARVRRCHG